MLKQKTLILFTVVAAVVVLFAYTSVEAEENIIELKNFEISLVDCAKDVNETTKVYKYTIVNKATKSKIKFIDVKVPANINLGNCSMKEGKNYNCLNIVTKFKGKGVQNIAYGPGIGADEPSRFLAGVVDGIVVRAVINKNLKPSDPPAEFTLEISNNAIGCDDTYLQLTRQSSSNYESGIIDGPFFKITTGIVTPSAAWKCKNLGNFETAQGTVPVTMRYLKESDGCTVFTENTYFFANDPECISSTDCTPGEDDCKLLGKGEPTADSGRKFCMGVGSTCDECMENSSGSPQEYWFWNNGQLTYSCFDLANPPFYLCPTACYVNAGC